MYRSREAASSGGGRRFGELDHSQSHSFVYMLHVPETENNQGIYLNRVLVS